ncbi:DNA-3-methyladenine glycosylase [Patescibacteria group bacterium]|jgi:DNA-3-methyladenine glycosylase|nr:DNA-3-methyladenine glycosylase [Patescibacteria group bacterium]
MMLAPSFFDQPADRVARHLLGATLCVRVAGEVQRLPCTELEAYLGPEDLACHAAKGRTKRTEAMFGPPGTLYVYLVYGMHEMLNLVTGPAGHPAAVLVRGAGPYDGPGKLTRALGIDRRLNGRALGHAAGVWIEERSPIAPREVIATPRIGVGYAGAWAEAPLRFVGRCPPETASKAKRNVPADHA